MELMKKARSSATTMANWVAKMASRGIDETGRQVPDPTPMAPPIGFNRQPSMVETVRAMVQSEALRAAAEAGGAETFEESEDFDIEGEEQLRSPWENEFDPPLSEILAAGEQALREKHAAEAAGEAGAPVKGAEGAREALDGEAGE